MVDEDRVAVVTHDHHETLAITAGESHGHHKSGRREGLKTR